MKEVRDPRGGTWRLRRRWLLDTRPLSVGAFDWRGPEGRAGGVEYHDAGVGQLKILLFLPIALGWSVLTVVDLARAFVAHLRGEPWVVEAELQALKRERLVWRVAGWSRSREALAEAAKALSRGEELTRFGEPERSAGDADRADAARRSP